MSTTDRDDFESWWSRQPESAGTDRETMDAKMLASGAWKASRLAAGEPRGAGAEALRYDFELQAYMEHSDSLGHLLHGDSCRVCRFFNAAPSPQQPPEPPASDAEVERALEFFERNDPRGMTQAYSLIGKILAAAYRRLRAQAQAPRQRYKWSDKYGQIVADKTGDWVQYDPARDGGKEEGNG